MVLYLYENSVTNQQLTHKNFHFVHTKFVCLFCFSLHITLQLSLKTIIWLSYYKNIKLLSWRVKWPLLYCIHWANSSRCQRKLGLYACMSYQLCITHNIQAILNNGLFISPVKFAHSVHYRLSYLWTQWTPLCFLLYLMFNISDISQEHGLWWKLETH